MNIHLFPNINKCFSDNMIIMKSLYDGILKLRLSWDNFEKEYFASGGSPTDSYYEVRMNGYRFDVINLLNEYKWDIKEVIGYEDSNLQDVVLRYTHDKTLLPGTRDNTLKNVSKSLGRLTGVRRPLSHKRSGARDKNQRQQNAFMKSDAVCRRADVIDEEIQLSRKYYDEFQVPIPF